MLEYIVNFLNEFLEVVLKILPTSPFQSYLKTASNIPYLSWLNWFLPVDKIIAIGQAWLMAVGTFYLYSIILRWIRAIE